MTIEDEGTELWQSTEFANAVNTLYANKIAYIKQIKLYAELRAEKYKALLEVGFDEAQALQIVINTNIFN